MKYIQKITNVRSSVMVTLFSLMILSACSKSGLSTDSTSQVATSVPGSGKWSCNLNTYAWNWSGANYASGWNSARAVYYNYTYNSQMKPQKIIALTMDSSGLGYCDFSIGFILPIDSVGTYVFNKTTYDWNGSYMSVQWHSCNTGSTYGYFTTNDSSSVTLTLTTFGNKPGDLVKGAFIGKIYGGYHVNNTGLGKDSLLSRAVNGSFECVRQN